MSESELIEELTRQCETYRMLYEGAMKKIERYRDVAAKPDIFIPEYNKDKFNDVQTAQSVWKASGSKNKFIDWLFERSVVESKRP